MAAFATAAPPLAIIGAGRWARELARSLRLLRPVTPLLMHSAAHGESLLAWSRSGTGVEGVRVTTKFDELARAAPAAVIIANAARDHAAAIDWALAREVPALVEKPFTAGPADTQRLASRARREGRLLCAAHVLKFASYLPPFAARVAAAEPAGLRIEWRDARQEMRYGTAKRYDASIPVFIDCLPHIVSMLEILLPGRAIDGESLEFERGGARLLLRLRVGELSCEVLLERNAEVRRRLVGVTGERALTLDFTSEPGVVTEAGISSNADPGWNERGRPVALMLDAFLAAVAGGVPDARLDVATAVHAADLIGWAAPIYNSRRLEWLQRTLAGPQPDHEDVSYALAENPVVGGPAHSSTISLPN
jgi:predicted dehydrogenase